MNNENTPMTLKEVMTCLQDLPEDAQMYLDTKDGIVPIRALYIPESAGETMVVLSDGRF